MIIMIGKFLELNMMLFKMDLIILIEIILINYMVLFKIVFMKVKVIEDLWKIMKLG